MRAREFITEERVLPPEQADPMRQTFILPGLTSSDPYETYRFGVAMARARSEAVKDDLNPFILPWDKEEVFGEYAVVAGINGTVDPIIDKALAMAGISGGKKANGSLTSEEPPSVDKTRPVRAFKGYPR
jgi:hypothetical protein